MAGINTFGNTVTPQSSALTSRMATPQNALIQSLSKTPAKRPVVQPGRMMREITAPQPASAAAQRSDLQGRDYFNNLAKTGTPSEQQAASIWMKNNPQTGLLGQQNTPPVNPAATSKSNEPGSLNLNPTPAPQQQQPPLDPSSAARAVYQASQPNALSQGATQAEAMYGMLGQQRQLQPFAGGQTQSLDQSYANLTRPQSTGNFTGEAGLFDVQRGILQNAAQTTAQNALAQQQLQTQGATSVLNAALPGQRGYGSTLYNPLTGQDIGGGASAGGAFGGGVEQGNLALGQQYAANNAAHQQSIRIKNIVQQYLASTPVNPSEFSDINKALQFIGGKTSDPRYQTLSNYLSEYISTLAPILGVGGDTTNLKTEIAQSFVNAQASGQSISQVLDSIDALAQQKLQAMRSAGTGFSTSGGTTGGGFAEAW